MPSRVFGLDLFRVVAEILVILAHYLFWVGYAQGWEFIEIFLIFGSLGLEFFFLMSGFLVGGIFLGLCDKRLDARAFRIFMLRRILRIVPPYFVWLLILWIFLPPLNSDISVLFSFLSFFQNFAWPLVAGSWFDVSWSLAVEFWFYIMFGCLGFLSVRLFGKNSVIYVMLFMFFIPLFARLSFAGVENWDLEMRKVVVFRLDSIIWGVLLAYLYRGANWPKSHTGGYAVLGGFFLALIIGFWWWQEGAFSVSSYFLQVFVLPLLSFSLCLVFPFILSLQCHINWLRQTIEFLSDSSYAVYLVHLTVAGWFVWLLKEEQPVAFILISTAVSLFLGWCSLKFIERPILARRPT